MSKNLFIISTDKKSGKSNMALGVSEVLFKNIDKVAYFRPIIQVSETRTIEDNFDLIKKYFNLQIDYSDMYAYTYEEAERLISEGKYDELIDTIIKKYKKLEAAHDFVLIEGTDYSGDMAILDIEVNVKIAHVLSCPVLIIKSAKEKDIKSLIQALKITITSYIEDGCNVIGIILTRAPIAKYEDYEKQLNKVADFKEMFLSVLYESVDITTPSVGEVAKFLNGTVLCGENQLNNLVMSYSVANMHVENYLSDLEDGTLVVTSADRLDIVLGILLANQSKGFADITGIILTSQYDVKQETLDIINNLPFSLPIVKINDDVQNILKKLEKLRIFLTPENTRKIALAFRIFDEQVDRKKLAKIVIDSKTDKMTPKVFEYSLIEKASRKKMHIVLPEGEEERILRATEILVLRDLVNITLLGNEEKIRLLIHEFGLNIENVNIIDPLTSDISKKYAMMYTEMRKHKGMTFDHALSIIHDVNYFGTMMVQTGDADGMVSGAVHSTANTIRPAFQIIKTKPDCPIESSLMIMCFKEKVVGYGDCAINPNPTSEELAYIAISSAETAQAYDIEPRIAMLSYSTGSSGKGEDVDKVREATRIAKEMRPDLKIEGPIQYDAAVSEEVARTKNLVSEVAGNATVLIFPDLNTGNNTQKAAQRESGAISIGPILQGLNKPVNDLSRSAKVKDIISTVTLTAIQAMQGE